MFDLAGNKVADTDENKLTPKGIASLKSSRRNSRTSWPPHELSGTDRSRVIDRCEFGRRLRGHEGHDEASAVRSALPEQLRDDPHPAGAGAAAGYQRRDHARPARLQHADLGRSGQAGHPEPHGGRRGRGDPRAEPASRDRPDRPAAEGVWPEDPGHHQDDGSIDRRQPVREHHRQDHARRSLPADQGHRPGRAGRQELRHR